MEEINQKIGIFILNYNGIFWLKKNLKNLINYSENADIIVIDNKSSDQSVNYINETFPSVKIKINKKNYGFAKGYNEVLLKEINFNYFILINNDVEVTKNWITPMLEILEKENIGIVQPKILNFGNKKKFDYAGGGGGFIDILGIPFCRGRILNNIEDDHNQYNDNIDIFWASGCCFMIKKEVFQSVNGFDEDFIMHQEEIDLCWRIQKLNKKVHYCSDSTVYHFGGGTLSYHDVTKNYYNHRNSLLLLFKNLSFFSLIVIFPVRLLMDYLIIFYHLLWCICFFLIYFTKAIKKIKISFLIMKAHLSFCLLFPRFLKKRDPIKSNLIYKGSIIFDYYFKGKKKFSKLKQF